MLKNDVKILQYLLITEQRNTSSSGLHYGKNMHLVGSGHTATQWT